MNTDAINEIRKAAEAAKGVSRASNEYDAYLDAVMIAFANPEKGLELCRLAEIGHCFVHDRPSDSKMEKMLRLEREYKEAKR